MNEGNLSGNRMVVLAPLLCVLLVGSVANIQPPKSREVSDEERVSRLMRMFRQMKSLRAASLGVAEPITVLQSDVYADGGSTFVAFRDARSVEFMTGKWSSYSHPIERCRHYTFRVTKPAHSIVRRGIVEEGDKRDRILCALLSRWADQDPDFHTLLEMNHENFRKWVLHVATVDSRNGEYTRLRANLFVYTMLAKFSRVEFWGY